MIRYALWLVLGWCFFTDCVAHPLGNLSVNRQTAITVEAKTIEIRYTLDLAEIPSLTAAEEADSDQNGQTTDSEWRIYTRRWVTNTLSKLDLKLDGQALTLAPDDFRWSLQAGVAGLQVLRLEARYRVLLTQQLSRANLDYRDLTVIPNLGWSEVFLNTKTGVKRLTADVPAHDRSNMLSIFPTFPDAIFPNESEAHAELEWLPIPAKSSTNLVSSSRTETLHVEANPVPDEIEPTSINVSPYQHIRSFFLLGLHHIATGWDHLVFVAGLLLLCLPWRKLIKVITAFTVAHSLTLALAALGWVALPGALIEPTIALSVAYIGLIVLMQRGDRGSPLLAFGFGLIHGFGFAGALAESMARDQMDGTGWLWALASFNLGIEAFQLMLVALIAPLLIGLRRYRWEPLFRRIGGSLVMGAGLGWFFSRALA